MFKTDTISRSIVLAFILAKAKRVKGLSFLYFAVTATSLFLVSSLTIFPLCIKDIIYFCYGDIFFPNSNSFGYVYNLVINKRILIFYSQESINQDNQVI